MKKKMIELILKCPNCDYEEFHNNTGDKTYLINRCPYCDEQLISDTDEGLCTYQIKNKEVG